MTYKNYLTQWTNNAKEKFKNFSASIKFDDENIQIVDWTASDTDEYSMRIIFDKQKGHMYIDGDLGTAVFHLSSPIDIEKTAAYNSVPYFMEKMVCSTNDYAYDEDKAQDELMEHLMPYASNPENEEKIKTLIEDIITDYDQFGDGICLSDEYRGRIAEFDPDYHEWAYSVGRLPAPRIIIWLTALKMIRENLQNNYTH